MPSRSWFSRSGLRVSTALVVAVLAASVAGCLTADGTLERDGTGRLALTFKAPPGATEASQRALLEAPGITIQSLSLAADRTVSTTLEVAELGAISKTKLLKDVTVTKTAQGEDEILTIKATNPPGRSLGSKSLPGPSIRLTLPGTVVEANEKGVVKGATVAWSFTLGDWTARTTWELTARYRPGAAAPAGKPDAPTPPAAGERK